jgi:hypothetical protein
MSKVTAVISTTLLAAALAAGDAFAQAQTQGPGPAMRSPGTTERAPTQDRQDRDRQDKDKQRQAWHQPQGALEANRVIGAKVRSGDRDLGSIDQLIIDQQDGRVTHAIVSMGGVVGFGATKVVVPWSAVKLDTHDGGRLTASVDQNTLDTAPRYEQRQAADRDRSPAASPPSERPTMRQPSTERPQSGDRTR